jgi:hypothetical protein
MARAVAEPALDPRLVRLAGAARRVDDHQLGRDAARLGQEQRAPVLAQMAVEVAGEEALERAVGKRQRRHVRAHELGARAALGGDLEHPFALIEQRARTVQVAAEEAGPARDVERPRGRQLGDEPLKRHELRLPAGPLALRERAGAEVPVVVLRGAAVVVRLHGAHDGSCRIRASRGDRREGASAASGRYRSTRSGASTPRLPPPQRPVIE